MSFGRRLLAILASDVVGYARLMEIDEPGTITRLREIRADIIDPLVAEHHGRVVKLMGDGALIAFESVVDAVTCAVAIQMTAAHHSAALPEPERIAFRIGVNLGDVALVEDDVYGEAVNVAARLQQIGEPGGVMVSGTAFDHLQGKLVVPLDFAGEQQVKNIERPIRVYRVRLDGVPVKLFRRRRSHLRVLAAGTALFALVVVGGVWWSRLATPLPIGKPSVAVLTFDNLAGDEATGSLAGGITEDIITDLSRFRDLDVIARNSTAAYKGKAIDVRQVGRDLGVRYVLKGSIQRQDDRVRVTAQLVDAGNAAHVWSERWDRPTEDIFAVQVDIAEQTAARLGGGLSMAAITTDDLARARRKPPASLSAYELYLIGVEGKAHSTKQSVERGLAAINRAIEIDPGFARAYTIRGWLTFFMTDHGLDWNSAVRSWGADLKQAMALDPHDAETLAALGDYYKRVGQLADSEGVIRAALALNPNHVHVLILAASNLGYVGKPEEAAVAADRALRLDPNMTTANRRGPNQGYFFARRFADVVAIVSGTPIEGRSFAQRFFLAASYAFLGKTKEAEAAKMHILRINPDLTAQSEYTRGWYFARQQEEDLFFESFRVLGLPMCATPEHLARIKEPKPLPECAGHK